MAKHIVELDKLTALMAAHLDERRAGVRAALQRVAERTLAYIQTHTVPVDTGRLRKSGRVTTRGAVGAPRGERVPTVVFGDRTAPYARFVEEGTATMAPRHFMRRSLPAAKAFLVEEVRRVMRDGARRRAG